MRQLIAGNWKMHGNSESLAELDLLRGELSKSPVAADVVICPPFTLTASSLSIAEKAFGLGGQDCAVQPSGAFTGDISAEMLKNAGASYVIVGHSERRQYHCETDELVREKAKAAWRAGLTAIICIGEQDADRESGTALDICSAQIEGSVPDSANSDNTVIAYEPVWAIGSGKTPTLAEIEDMHGHIRKCLAARFGFSGKSVRILYGGSVKPSNARDILALPEVGGALVGGASLKATDFLAIISAAKKLV